MMLLLLLRRRRLRRLALLRDLLGVLFALAGGGDGERARRGVVRGLSGEVEVKYSAFVLLGTRKELSRG